MYFTILRCDCKNSYLQSQESGVRDQESVKTETWAEGLLLNYSCPDFLQVHLLKHFIKNLVHPVQAYVAGKRLKTMLTAIWAKA